MFNYNFHKINTKNLFRLINYTIKIKMSYSIRGHLNFRIFSKLKTRHVNNQFINY